MKKLRIGFNLIIVLSTCSVVGTLAFENLVNKEYKIVLDTFLQIMHISLFIGSIMNLIFLRRRKEWRLFFFTGIPLIFLILSVIAFYYGFKFSSILLLVFDFYIILWFHFLLIKEVFLNNKKNKVVLSQNP